LFENRENTIKATAYIKFFGGFGALIFGYILMAVGALSLIMAAYHAWTLFVSPDSITVFADALHQTALKDQEADAGDQEFFRILAWPIVVFLLLLQGKVGAWAIEAAVHLLDVIHGGEAKKQPPN
jgi:hypothetical protein